MTEAEKELTKFCEAIAHALRMDKQWPHSMYNEALARAREAREAFEKDGDNNAVADEFNDAMVDLGFLTTERHNDKEKEIKIVVIAVLKAMEAFGYYKTDRERCNTLH